MHKLSARRDDVRIKFELLDGLVLKSDLVRPLSLDAGLSPRVFLCVASGTEPTRSLLVLFGSRRNAIDSEVNQLLGLHKTDYLIGVGVYVVEDLGFGLRLGPAILGVGTRMDDAVHV